MQNLEGKRNNQGKLTKQQSSFELQNVNTQNNSKFVNVFNNIFDTHQNLILYNQNKNCQIIHQNQTSYCKSRKIQNKIDWSCQQLKLLAHLYYLHGSTWSILVPHFKKKNQTSIKNKINNSIKKAALILRKYEINSINVRGYKNRITYSLLSSMMQFANQTQKIALTTCQAIDNDSIIYKFRKSIIQLSFGLCQLNNKEMQELIRSIRQINKKTKSFGHFKAKHKKKWKMMQQKLQSIRELYKVDKELVEKLPSEQSNIQKNQKVSGTNGQQLQANFQESSMLQSLLTEIIKKPIKSQRSFIEDVQSIIGDNFLQESQQFLFNNL